MKIEMGGRSPGPSQRERKPAAGGERSRGQDPCDISFTTPLAHVRTAQSSNVTVGQILNVSIQLVTQKKTIVCKKQRSGEIIGYVLARGASKLIECIEQDNIYLAEVRKADFGHIEVMVRRSV
jgi:hypothetical protein